MGGAGPQVLHRSRTCQKPRVPRACGESSWNAKGCAFTSGSYAASAIAPSITNAKALKESVPKHPSRNSRPESRPTVYTKRPMQPLKVVSCHAEQSRCYRTIRHSIQLIMLWCSFPA